MMTGERYSQSIEVGIESTWKDFTKVVAVLVQCQWDLPGLVSITIATLDTPFLAGKQKHACVDSKAGWYELENSSG